MIPSGPRRRRAARARACAPVAQVVAAVFLLALAAPVHAQLLSPGPLTRTHAALEGVRNCTQCHALGRRGIDPAKCLTCHTPIRDRIRRGEGLHANVARDCATCHSDHEGRAFDPAPVTARGFDHDRTGFALAGEHRGVACRSCHTPARITDATVRRTLGAAGRLSETFLGVGETCETCHQAESPHTARLAGQSCQTCHAPTGWDDTRNFQHRQTGFALTGAHASASCTGCHGAEGRGAARFRNVPDDCASCHRDESPHGNQFAGQTCGSCHETTRWSAAADGFNHAQTGFPLAGAHTSVSCASCHGSGPAARFAGTPEACASCHSDESPHGNQFAGQSCQTCHAPTRWSATPGFSHARTGFPLVGAHVEASCGSCHDGGARAVFSAAETACASCHEDAHDGALGADCQTCHAPTAWGRMAATFDAGRFDHEAHTGFALVGAHAGAACQSCHGDGATRGETVRDDAGFHITAAGSGDGATFPAVVAAECRSCHTDAHAGTLDAEADCQSCHGQDAFAPATFGLARHQTETTFALTGAHVAVPCSACHGTDARPDFVLAPACETCHAETSPHGTQFAGPDGVTACADCHATEAWSAAAFDHAGRTGFALSGAHATAECQSCHARPDGPAGTPWTFEGLGTDCASCHETPHVDQFEGRTCSSCHDTAAFTVAHFDHEATRFPLAGAHVAVACGSCHRPEPAPGGGTAVRFRPLPTACADCHGAGE